MIKHGSETTKNCIIIALLLLLIPFVVNCFFAYPQTDDFVFSVLARDSGFLKAQLQWYESWTGRFTSTALLSVNPLVHGSLAGYRLCLALLLMAQLASLYLLTDALTRHALSWKEKLIFSLALSFAFLDRMEDVRSGLYWMAGVVTYQVAATLALLVAALLVHLRRGDAKSRLLLPALVLLSLLLAGTNEIACAVALLLSVCLIAWRFVARRDVAGFEVATFLALAAGSGFSLLAPGNLVRMHGYHERAGFFSTARDALCASLQAVMLWISYPSTLILAAMVVLVMIKKPEVRTPFAGSRVLHAALLLLFCTFVCFFIPWWSTGMYPQNRVINMIYLFFLLGWMATCAVACARWAERVGAFSGMVPLKTVCVAGLAYVIALSVLGSSNFLTVGADLVRGDSLRYAEEMRQKESLLRKTPERVCVTEDVRYTPRSLYFCFLSPRGEDWVNHYYARYLGKKSISLRR